MDRAIIVVLALAVVLLLTDRLVPRKSDGAAAIPDKSIAVLPLANASGDDKQQFFSDGLSENLIIALSQFDGLQVIGRNSAFQFRDSKDDAKTIGAKLSVAHLLEGSVQHAGDAVRISVELINAATGRTLWSQRYDRPYTDLFKLQDEITQSVAGALKAKLLSSATAAAQSDRPPSGNLDAYSAYLQGNFYYARNTEADFRKAIDAYITATRLDPNYALAWTGISQTSIGLASQYLDGTAAQQVYAQARAAADKALALAPDLAAAYMARGQVHLVADFDWNAADADNRRGLELAPNDGNTLFYRGNLLATLGQLEQAVALTRQALTSDPLNSRWHNWLGIYLSGLGRLDEAEQAIRKAIELQPTASAYHEYLTVVAIQSGDAKAALAAAQQEPAGMWRDEALALAQQIGGDRAAADTTLKTLIDHWADQGPYQIAEVYALRRDVDKTFEWLERAWTARDPGISYLLYDPFILRYRDDPRFGAFCKKVGLPATTDAKALP
jgi:TolB-like protein/Tfp pilus assembly protein PilF